MLCAVLTAIDASLIKEPTVFAIECHYASQAQQDEHRAFTPAVGGSIPLGRTTKETMSLWIIDDGGCSRHGTRELVRARNSGDSLGQRPRTFEMMP